MTGQVSAPRGRVPPTLILCRGCRQYIWPKTRACPHCGGKVATLARTHRRDEARQNRLIARIERLLSDIERAGG